MEALKPDSAFKMEFKPEIWKMEKYVTEISVPENYSTLQPDDSAISVKFSQSGMMPKPYYSKSISMSGVASFSSKCCRLLIKKFVLPYAGGKILTMKPFRVELLDNNTIIKEFLKEFPAKKLKFHTNSSKSSYYYYSTSLDLSSIWKDNVDLIKITWNISVQQLVQQTRLVGINPLYFASSNNQYFDLKKEIGAFHNSEELSDATILCGIEVIPVHRCILALDSPVFRSMFTTDMKEKKEGQVPIEDFDIKIVRLLVEWMYTREIGLISLQDKMDLFKAADKYQVESLKKWCIAQICAKISPDNVLEIYEFGEAYEEGKIKEKCLEIMRANITKVFVEGSEVSEEFVMGYPSVMLELVNSLYNTLF